MVAAGALTATAATLGSCGGTAATTDVPKKWDRETDVVVGYGGAGAAAALAEALGINAAELEATVAKYNADVAAALFGKTANLQPLDEGPFYAAPMIEWYLGSHGGVRINTSAQVLDTAGEVIPRLCAGGMVAGGITGACYPGSGTAVATLVCYGRIAGQKDAAEQTWA